MRWLLPILIFDVVAIAFLLTGGVKEERADLVFASSSEHNNLDPQQLSWSHDIRIVENLFEPLVKIKIPELVPEPGVAESWTISPDGLTYTFKLRENALWSNGDPVKSSDFVYAWRRALLPDLAADYTQLFWAIEGAEEFFNWRSKELETYAKLPKDQKSEDAAKALLTKAYAHFRATVGIKTPDDRTLIIKLKQPVPYLLQLAAFVTWVPVHEKTCDAQTTMDPDSGRLIQSPYWIRPVDRATEKEPALVCNGPYVLQSRRFRRDLLMTANKHFRDYAIMGNKSVRELIIPDGQAQFLMFNRGEVDWIPSFVAGQLGPELVQQKNDGKRDDVHAEPAAGTYFYMFNCNEKLIDGSPNPLHDPRVRRALTLAIDRKTIVKEITRMNQRVATTFIPPGSLPGYDAPVDPSSEFDPKRARQLLEEAGYPGGKGLTNLSILYNNEGNHGDVAQFIAYTWKKELGVDIPTKGVEVKTMGESRKKQDFSICRGGWYGDYLDPTTFTDCQVSGNGNNDGKYSNPTFDALMKKAAIELDPVKRNATLREAEALMLSEAAIAPIYQYINVDLFDPKKVKHMHLNPWSFRRTENVVVERGKK